MSTAEKALKAAIEELETLQRVFEQDNSVSVIEQCKAALADAEKCEPVGIFDGHFTGDLNGNVWIKLRVLNGIPKINAKFYTSPQPRDWVDSIMNYSEIPNSCSGKHKMIERLIEKHKGECTFFGGELVGAYFTVANIEKLCEGYRIKKLVKLSEDDIQGFMRIYEIDRHVVTHIEHRIYDVNFPKD